MCLYFYLVPIPKFGSSCWAERVHGCHQGPESVSITWHHPSWLSLLWHKRECTCWQCYLSKSSLSLPITWMNLLMSSKLEIQTWTVFASTMMLIFFGMLCTFVIKDIRMVEIGRLGGVILLYHVSLDLDAKLPLSCFGWLVSTYWQIIATGSEVDVDAIFA